ncbi:hypothetical protein [Planctomicrobium sp. SH527]|uniref:hypothetical protein n=1 Tax=Planctomicrobium sp. SH527 TaxID=3448123 RepID=UPI003F5C6875
MFVEYKEIEPAELRRIEQEFSEQRTALNDEAEQLTQRLLAWRERRAAIDEALEKLRQRLTALPVR